MPADHSNTITINIFLSPSPPQRAGFSVPLLLVDQDTGNGLGGARVVTYSSASEAEAAQVAGDISAQTLDFVQAAFSQQPTLDRVKVGRVDTANVTPETYADGLAAVEAVDNDFYGVTIDRRTDADILVVSAAIETREKLFVAQSNDVDWLTTGLPAGLTALAARERTAVTFHDTDTEPADIAWLASRLVFDPDVTSAQWEGQVRDVAALAALTTAQRDFAVANNANLGLPFSSAPYYVSPGLNQNTRGIYEILTGDWFAARVREDVSFLKLEHTARGEKLIVDGTGQAKVLTLLNTRLQQGMDAGHFVQGQARVTAEAITMADTLAQRLRFKVEAQVAQDARLFEFNIFLQRDPVLEVA